MKVTKVDDKTFIEEERHDGNGTKAAAWIGFGTGLAALLNQGGGGGLFGNFFGNNRNYEQHELNHLNDEMWNKFCNLEKGMYELYISGLNRDGAMREKDVDEKFRLYANDIANYNKLAERISGIETQVAVAAAVRPYQDKILSDRIREVGERGHWALALETERRCCADNLIVNYDNQTFAPLYTASVEPGATAVTYTQKSTFNPLCMCCNGNRVA